MMEELLFALKTDLLCILLAGCSTAQAHALWKSSPRCSCGRSCCWELSSLGTVKCTGAGATMGCLVFATLSSGLGPRQGCSINFPSLCGSARLCRRRRGWCWHQICARGLLTAGQVFCRAGMGKWPYFCQINQSCDTLYASSVISCQIDANWGMTDNSWYSTKCKWCREMITWSSKKLAGTMWTNQCFLNNLRGQNEFLLDLHFVPLGLW